MKIKRGKKKKRRLAKGHRAQDNFTQQLRLISQILVVHQLDAYIGRFGRVPGQGDPMFFSPLAQGPDPVKLPKKEEYLLLPGIIDRLTSEGVHPALIYAIEKVGFLDGLCGFGGIWFELESPLAIFQTWRQYYNEGLEIFKDVPLELPYIEPACKGDDLR